MQNKTEIEKNIVKLESIEAKLKDDEKLDYYGKLYKLYGKIQDTARSAAVEKKLQ